MGLASVKEKNQGDEVDANGGGKSEQHQNRTTLREFFNKNQSQCVVFPLKDARTQDGENTQIEDY